MSEIVVATLYQLGKKGDSFSKDYKEVSRSGAKVDLDYIKEFNQNWKMRGQYYEIDEKATAERNKSISGTDTDLEAAKEKYFELFRKAPNGKMKLETMQEKILEKENENK